MGKEDGICEEKLSIILWLFFILKCLQN